MKNNFISRLIVVGIVAIIVLLAASSPSLLGEEAKELQTNASYELQDGQITFKFELENKTSVAHPLVFSSGQQYEIVVKDAKQQEVYRFSDGRAFTMALIYKTLKSDDSYRWQSRWDLTNKDGEKVPPGEYTAEIVVMAIPTESKQESIKEQFKTEISFTIPEPAQAVIATTAKQVIQAIHDKDTGQLASYVHQDKGVRFTPYTYVSLEQDVVFTQEEIADFFFNQNVYLWGYYDGSGFEIQLTPSEYYDKFIYSVDFVSAPEVGYNEVLSLWTI